MPFVKLADFGFSKSESMSSPKSRVGTIAYVAPEVIKNSCSAGTYCGKQSDVWSCGVILHKMLFGSYPFDIPPLAPSSQHPAVVDPRDRERSMMSRILRAQWNVPEGLNVTEACIDLLQKIFTEDPLQRITIAQVQRHEWFSINLPPEALVMNDAYMSEQGGHVVGHVAACVPHKHKDEESIRLILNEAFQGADNDAAPCDNDGIDHEMIDEAIREASAVSEDTTSTFSNSV